jgi:hypothetical protein
LTTPEPPNYAIALVGFAESLFGEHNWQAALSRLTGAPKRTVVRIAGAAREGRDHPAARRTLNDLDQRLIAISASLKPWSDRGASQRKD